MAGGAEYLWSSRTPNLTGQTIQFWDHLDRKHSDADFAALPAQELGRMYVRFHASGDARPLDELRHYTERVEREGWVHPATEAITAEWQRQLRLLGVHDPGLSVDRPPDLSVEETVRFLVRHHLCLDHRRYGGPVYLDGSRWGMPLRKVVGADGHANYLLVILRDLVPHLTLGRRVLLIYDDDLSHDYALLAQILAALGALPSRLALGRVALDGAIQSSRHGGWEAYTLGRVAALCLDHFDPRSYRLGMRLYFIAMLKRTSSVGWSFRLLHRALTRAERMIKAASSSGRSPADTLARLRACTRPDGWVDPYRLTDGLFARRNSPPPLRLLSSVYL
ncbi:hypothetical protein [Streptosporangium sp. NPDC002721]|uniref:hypothetical protein n=1 Tax=Streptosporangium sp. NPDC002721 TaxID=3366188 RepID=UPI0036D040C6